MTDPKKSQKRMRLPQDQPLPDGWYNRHRPVTVVVESDRDALVITIPAAEISLSV